MKTRTGACQLASLRRRLARGSAAAIGVALLAGLAARPPSVAVVLAQPATPAAAASGVWRQAVGPYRLALIIGPPEVMYTAAQIAAQHPMAGEQMLAGTMAMAGSDAMPGMEMSGKGMTGAAATSMAMAGMAMPTTTPDGLPRHLELHVWDAQSGHVVTDAHVTIEVVDQTAQRTVALPIATMQGIREGPADFHYGNAIWLQPGHVYAIDVAVNGQRATFAIGVATATPAAGSPRPATS